MHSVSRLAIIRYTRSKSSFSPSLSRSLTHTRTGARRTIYIVCLAERGHRKCGGKKHFMRQKYRNRWPWRKGGWVRLGLGTYYYAVNRENGLKRNIRVFYVCVWSEHAIMRKWQKLIWWEEEKNDFIFYFFLSWKVARLYLVCVCMPSINFSVLIT